MKDIIISKSEMTNAKIEPGLKMEVESICSNLWLTPAAAIKIFYRQVKLLKCLPFNIRIPNETTSQTLKVISAGKKLIHCEDEKVTFSKMRI